MRAASSWHPGLQWMKHACSEANMDVDSRSFLVRGFPLLKYAMR
jgi:hypothetical protein